MTSSSRSLFLLELNEFNFPLAEEAARESGLKNLKTVLGLPRSETLTNDTYESNYLEPWVQWVSVHTGKPSSEHKVQHLGDVPRAEFPQLWEILGKKGLTSGMWGVMNATRRDASGCKYFLPDPWTFSEEAYPESLNDLLALPRYLSTNYLKISKLRSLKLAGSFLSELVSNVGIVNFLESLGMLIKGLFKHGPRHFIFIVWFEYLSAICMIRRSEREPTNLKILFINSIAHLQHHHWKSGALTVTPEIAFGYAMIDKVLGRILQMTESSGLLVTNAFTQINTNSDPAWILYRPLDQDSFISTLGIPHERVESLMTHDAHVFFKNTQEADQGEKILRQAQVRNKNLFVVDRNEERKLFYRIDFFDEAAAEEIVRVNGREFKFGDLFARIVKRTGKHSGAGTALSRDIALPSKLMNHELFGHMTSYLIDLKNSPSN